jgi:hypothetical protein
MRLLIATLVAMENNRHRQEPVTNLGGSWILKKGGMYSKY